MPNIATRGIFYTSEVTGQTFPINFKISQPYQNSSFAQTLNYRPKFPALCPMPNILYPRHVEVLLTNGQRIKLPISQREEVRSIVISLSRSEDVVCVDYIGERWVRLRGFGNPAFEGYRVGNQLDNINGAIEYDSDVLGEGIVARVSIPQDIPQLEQYARKFAGTVDTGLISPKSIQGFKPRRIGLRSQNLTNADEQEKSEVNRLFAISLSDNIIRAAGEGSRLANVLYYTGEILPKANIFFDDAPGGASSGGGESG